MSKLKNILSTVMQTTTQAADGWRFLRQAVHEIHGFVGLIDKALVSFESRLARLEAEASGGGGSRATPRGARKRLPRRRAA
jgi:hypothetical protein